MIPMNSSASAEYSIDISLISRYSNDWSELSKQITLNNEYESNHQNVDLIFNLNDTITEYQGMNISFDLSNFTSIESPNPSQLLNTSVIIRIISYTIILIACLIGNILALITLMSSSRMRNVTNCFLVNLALSDLLLGIFCMPITLIGSIIKDFVFGPIMCKIIPYFQAVSVGVSGWTLVAISFERYFAICQPLESRRWQTMSHSYRVIAIIWTLNLILMSPIAVINQLVPLKTPGKHKCRELWSSAAVERVFNWFLFAVLLVVPLIILVITYSLVSRQLYGTNIFQSNYCTPTIAVTLNSEPQSNHLSTFPSNSHLMSVSYDCKSGFINGINGSSEVMSKRSKLLIETNENKSVITKRLRLGNSRRVCNQTVSKKRIVRMLCVLVIEFFVCWTPIYVINIWSLYWPKKIYSLVSPSVISYIHLLSYLNSCTNPITYCFMHKKFRDALMMILRNKGSTNRYVITEFDHSVSNPSQQSVSSGISGQTHSASSQTTNCFQMSQYNNRNAFRSQLVSNIQIRNSII